MILYVPSHACAIGAYFKTVSRCLEVVQLTGRLHILMAIELSDYRLRIGLHYYRQAKVKGLSYLTTFELGIVLSMLRLRCGDIEQNPGPV